MRKIGIDIGRVIIGGDSYGDTPFIGVPVERAILAPPVRGSFDTIRDLVRNEEGRVWLVSKCGASVQAKTLRWLEHWDFHARTGLGEDHVRFCLKRPEKATIARELGLTHFIDDRVDVLEHLRGLVPHLFLFGQSSGPIWCTLVPTWETVRRALL